jgi:crotonobetainyl-CoA:carnitine CoA-transferase CaiB-like acyl-CoA transferase
MGQNPQRDAVDPLTQASVAEDGAKIGKRKVQEMRDKTLAEARGILDAPGFADVGANAFAELKEHELRGECVKRGIVSANIMSVEEMATVLHAADLKRRRDLIKVRAPAPAIEQPGLARIPRMRGLPPSKDGKFRAKADKLVSVAGYSTKVHAGAILELAGYGARALESLVEQGLELEAVTPDLDPPAEAPAA